MKRYLKTLIFAGVSSTLAVVLALNSFASATVPGNNIIASLTSAGAQSSEDSTLSSMSQDGRFVVFANSQNNLAGTDGSNDRDIFVKNLDANGLTRVSVSTSGAEAYGTTPVISETGRYVVFASNASNLIDGRTITTAYYQLFLRDTVSNTTTLISEISSGVFANAHLKPLNVSTDGRFVLLTTTATNLGPTVISGYTNLYQLDRQTNTFEWINKQGPGITYGRDTIEAQMSCDGSFIVFDSEATYLGLPNVGKLDVFLLDRRNGDTLTNVTSSAVGAAMKARISCNGSYIGFASYGVNLDPTKPSTGYHAFRYDRINATFRLLDQSSAGVVANTNIIYLPGSPVYLSLSDRGSAIFKHDATNLDSISYSGDQLFVRNPEAGTTELLTRDSGGTAANDISTTVTMSLDGKKVSYESLATSLVGTDTNAKRDVFVSETGF